MQQLLLQIDCSILKCLETGPTLLEPSETLSYCIAQTSIYDSIILGCLASFHMNFDPNEVRVLVQGVNLRRHEYAKQSTSRTWRDLQFMWPTHVFLCYLECVLTSILVFAFELHGHSNWLAYSPSYPISVDISLASLLPWKTPRKQLRSGVRRVTPAQAGETHRCLHHQMANLFSLTSPRSLPGVLEILLQSRETAEGMRNERNRQCRHNSVEVTMRLAFDMPFPSRAIRRIVRP